MMSDPVKNDPNHEDIIKKIETMSISNAATTYKILVAGGSFGGKSFLNKFLQRLDSSPRLRASHFDITLVDPRSGFVNILAIPRSVMNLEFARQTYATDLELPFGKPNEKYTLQFTHGLLTNLTPTHGEVTLVENDEITDKKVSIPFDYCVFATGRSRPWPFDPKGYSKDKYLAEMAESHAKISAASAITVVGAGAVGIETASELKCEFPAKRIILVHPYATLPPEDLKEDFKEQTQQRLKDLGVELMMNTRLLKEVEGGFITNHGEEVKSDLILWCGSKKNNLQSLQNEHFQNSVDPVTWEVAVNNKFQIIENYDKTQYNPFDGTYVPKVKYDNIFAIGDVSKLPVIKAAGGAAMSADVVALNIFQKHIRLETPPPSTTTTSTTIEPPSAEETEIEEEAKELLEEGEAKIEPFKLEDDKTIEPWSNGMLMLVGPGYAIGTRDGDTAVNTEIAVKCYEDFCNGFVSTFYHVVFENVKKWDV